MNNGNKNNSSTLLILGGFILVLGLLAIGYRITTVSFGPVSLGFNEPPASNSNSNNDNVVNNSSSQETTTTTDNFQLYPL
ncbi:MAG: hypothetical protein IPM76_07910 [Chloroflexi bacterium]|nr:hypothetical protein [Chloroflexota bacterium]